MFPSHDLGGGIAFDPTTWIFGPKAMGMLGRASTARGASSMARSHLAKRTAQDIVRVIRSPEHGNMEVAMLLGWLDETGHMDEALDVLGVRREQVLPRGAWKTDDPRGVYAQELDVDELMNLLDEADRVRVTDPVENFADDLAQSMKDKGVDRAIELEYSLEEGTLRLADGAKRIAAARHGDIPSLPVTVRVRTSATVDSLPTVKGVAKENVAHYARLANQRVKADTIGEIPMDIQFRSLNQVEPGGVGGARKVDTLDVNGKQFESRMVIEDNGSTAYFVVDDGNQVRAGVLVDDVGHLHAWTDEGFRGTGLQNFLWDSARKMGDELLDYSGKSGMLSQYG